MRHDHIDGVCADNVVFGCFCPKAFFFDNEV